MRISKKQLTDIKKISEKMRLKYLYLFGSQARGNVGPLSDFDFAVKFDAKNKDKFRSRLKLMNELSEIFRTEKIDVVDIEKADPILSFNIFREGKKIYVSDKDERSMDQFKSMRTFLDRRYYYDRHFKIALKQLADFRL